MKICGIYGLLNTANGKWYVGQSDHITRRIKSHFAPLLRGTHYNQRLQRDFSTFGRACFEVKILEECSCDLLDEREQAWIDKHRSSVRGRGYNAMDVIFPRCKFTDEHRKKISDTWKAKPMTEARRANIRRLAAINLGSKWTAEQRAAFSLARRGKPHKGGYKLSEETRRKMSASRLGRKLGPMPQSQRDNLSRAHSGKKLTAEHIRKVVLAKLGYRHSPETCRKIADSNRRRVGMKMSAAACAKMSAAQYRRYATSPQQMQLWA